MGITEAENNRLRALVRRALGRREYDSLADLGNKSGVGQTLYGFMGKSYGLSEKNAERLRKKLEAKPSSGEGEGGAEATNGKAKSAGQGNGHEASSGSNGAPLEGNGHEEEGALDLLSAATSLDKSVAVALFKKLLALRDHAPVATVKRIDGLLLRLVEQVNGLFVQLASEGVEILAEAALREHERGRA